MKPFDPPLEAKGQSLVPHLGKSRSPLGGQKGGVPPFTASGSAAGLRDAPRRADVQLFAKSMLKAIPKEDMQTIKGYDSADLNFINSLLAEEMLRVDGCKSWQRRQREKAEAVNRLHYELEDAKKKADAL